MAGGMIKDVIPAQAGIYSAFLVDSHIHGNDEDCLIPKALLSHLHGNDSDCIGKKRVKKVISTVNELINIPHV